ncbi:SGNH/GDSL hydrolase family protein [Streptomyces sp. CC228A]|uniref:SGNH/GDSL hydrolase family protein n=1 Tax=Streptomyces sp. CC228A TaxID=2898186 RepID=UPI001F2B547D|nr:SGNH/GDSL hydrolase family protein [Streptomyces sp. CC228A]
MARHRFGGIADYVISRGTDDVATLEPGTVVTCWNASSGGTQYTDLTEVDGVTPIVTLTADTEGAVPEFMGPDGVRSLYLDANGGSGPRRRSVATDIGEDLTDVESDITALQGSLLDKTTIAAKGDLLVGTAAATAARVGVASDGMLLVADSLQAAGVRWGAGWRRRDLPDPLLADAVSAEAPTITVTQQSTSTIASAQALLPPDTGPFLYLGAGDFEFGAAFPDTTLYLPTSRYPNTYSSGQSNWAVEFATDAAEFEIMFKYISSATKYRLTVDGRKVTDLAQLTGASSAGSRHVLKVAFASATPRRIRFDFTTMPFGGLYLEPGATAWRPTSQGGRLGVLGDSISDGSSENTGAGIGTWVYRAGRLLGCTDVWDQARGGTGYITPGSYTTFANRVAGDITPYDFDRLIVWGGYNDSGGDQGAIGTAAEALYGQLLGEVVPGGEVVVIGCWSPVGSPPDPGTLRSTDATLKAAALAAGVPFISPITGEVYSATGVLLDSQGEWITTENASSYVGGDGVHPTDNGHAYLARRIVEALKVLMPA